jgi:predicted ATPase/class 3 adenylate cyclase
MPTAASDLPEGRVTMLFTDIEGSTSHLRRLGDGYAQVLADQRRILRAAIADHGGHEMGTEGDSFFVVFAEPAEALAAAVEAQRALDANPWTGGAPVRVRMGLHCGDLARHDEGYVGLELNRAARIASTANGGQIVVSAAMRDAAGATSVGYRDLGLHRLKDLPAPERLHQVLADGVPDITTPIKSLGAASNLPVARADLVGRDEDVDRIVALVDGGARLVTLTGPGGVGKTSLALVAAAALERRFVGGGLYFVDLSGATAVADAWPAIGAAIGAQADDGDGDGDLGGTLAASGATLLVLDNLEQLPDAAGLVTALLDAAPSLQVLATSRGPLRLRAEQQYPVSTLDEPDAAELFVREARRARPAFEPDDDERAAIASLCARVDRLPLAIAVVASRIRHLGVAAIARSLDERLDVASRDVDRPDRHRTLFATVAWSASLLDPTMQRQFARLSVFAGGCTVEAAAVVLDVDELEAFDVLDALADLSLIAFADFPDGTARVTLMQVAREYATSLLHASPEEDRAARAAHARHYADVAEDAERRLHGPEQQAAGDRLALEHDNLRAAFEWAQSGGPDERRIAGRIAAALGWFWYTHGRAADGRRWLELTAAWDLELLDPPLAVRTVQALGVLQQQQGENGAALLAFSRALALAEAAGDETAMARARNSLGITHWAEGRLDVARQHLEESVAIGRRLGDEQRIAAGLSNLGIVLLTARDHDAAVAVLREALVIDRRRGDEWGIAVDQINLGTALVRRGDLAEGLGLLRSTLARARELGDPDLFASGVEACAMAAALAGDPRDAVALAGGADRLRQAASAPRAPSEDAFLERELGPARAALGRTEVDAITASSPDGEGELLALVDAVAERLAGARPG